MTVQKDWRAALLSSPDYQAARKEVAPQLEELKKLQKLILPAHSVWLEHDPARPFDAALALFRFLKDLGFGQQAPPESATQAGLAQEQLCDAQSLALLISVLTPTQCKDLKLSHLAARTAPSHSDWLDAIARLSLKPFATQLALLHFRPLFMDLAARWILFTGFNGHEFVETGATETRQIVLQVFHGFAQVLEYNWALYPFLQVLLRHPLVTQDPFDLLDPEFQPQDLSGFVNNPPPTYSDPEEGLDQMFGHPQLLPILWSLHRLLMCDETLHFQQGLQGWRYPPPLLEACLKRHPSIGVRILAWHVYRLWAALFTSNGDKLLHQWVCEPDVQGNCPPWPQSDTSEEEILFRQQPLGQASGQSTHATVLVQHKLINAWLASTEEHMHAFEFLKQLHNSVDGTPSMTSQDSVMDIDAPEGTFTIDPENFCSLVSFNANSVLLPKEQPIRALLSDSIPQTTPDFVLTVPALKALKELSLAFFSRTPILLSAAPASGKSSMIAHLAASLGSSSIVSISLADRSIDAKSLLGSLSSSVTDPGTFTFIDGTLTRCLKQGKWLVLDDIEMAAPDVLALISTLAERMRERSRYMPAGAHGGFDGRASVGVLADGQWIAAREGFALFATTSNLSPPRWLGSQFWANVVQDPLGLEDMAQVLKVSHHKISDQLLEEILVVWQTVCECTQPGQRQTTFRDLFKWCRRVNGLVPPSAAGTSFRRNPTFQEESFLEAVDVFFGSFNDIFSEASQQALTRLAETLGLSSERGMWLLQGRTPECIFPTAADATRKKHMQVGRITLSRDLRPLAKNARPFALTRPSLSLMEQLAVCTHFTEPVLLVGETGTGKTTTVSQLAMLLGRELISLNMSNQSEASDLIGGFKPIDLASEAQKIGHGLVDVFSDLFDRTFGLAKNMEFISAVRTALDKKRWSRLVALWREACKMADKKINGKTSKEATPSLKRRKTELDGLVAPWQQFREDITDFEARFASRQESKLSFSFVEGPLVKAIQHGNWILLDEINLASAETLESISALLSSPDASLVVTERGDLEPVQRHPNFRIFACMNPATDVGKRDLPPGLRAKFTELYVPPPDVDRASLLAIVEQYIGQCAIGDKGVVSDVADLYSKIKALALSSQLADGANAPPHYSVRTLARALTYASDNMSVFGLRRAVYEGFIMTFTMLLDTQSTTTVTSLIKQHLFRNDDRARAVLSKTPDAVAKRDREAFAAFHHFKLARGNVSDDANLAGRYVITPSVKDKITNLARVVSAQRYPVLIQGPTSSGKTSIIEYLAARTGHRFVRINNHEHTDIQEYLGTYTSDPQTGKLVFREGLLVQALRRGDWIVLDELNLAPTDVLEALNRLLDDNRELVIPETQEVVRPHPHFMLFATQNPPNSFYGGRKALSRAFRNRFLEMHFDDVPRDELESILETRCAIAPSYAKKIVAVFDELQHRRQAERVFEEKQSFATLRDLFRWGGREAIGYGQLARNGYLLIAERARSPEDKATVHEVLERVLKVSIDLDSIYAEPPASSSNLVWTSATRRLLTLVSEAIKFGEPVLLVGETGTGKTSICQHLAAELNLSLRIVNCHLNTDAADILGGYRPTRQADSTAMFEWHDGPLVESMKAGGLFLMDEISLADDSVLERLNSVLEPAKTLVLAEKGGSNLDELLIQGRPDFHVLATMNPGGDFGKKELSPALRNRFTEIWVPAVDDDEDLLQIIGSTGKLGPKLPQHILAFSKWFAPRFLDSAHVTLRSLLAWVQFIQCASLSPAEAFVHGALMTLVDGLGSLPSLASSSENEIQRCHQECVSKLLQLAEVTDVAGLSAPQAEDSPSVLTVGPFSIPKTTSASPRISNVFNLTAPTPRENTLRLLRALQISKPVLLEGSPGVGKTSLVAALAEFTGQSFVRINLSDQTDLADLFGSDMPVDGGAPGEFAWRDAPFLTALRLGHWVLLDEMNLAPQPVLEGLNSCLDHRGEVFIPELGQVFKKHPNFRIFAAQNPTHQGGSRKGLPRSFVDRFTQVFVAPLQRDDLLAVCKTSFPEVASEVIQNVINYSIDLGQRLLSPTSAFGASGSPWDFNLRDMQRWLSLLTASSSIERFPSDPVEYLDLCVVQRFRTSQDRAYARDVAVQHFGGKVLEPDQPIVSSSNDHLVFGHSIVPRFDYAYLQRHQSAIPAADLNADLAQSILKACAEKWLVILTGDNATGKTSQLRSLASATGNHLEEFNVSNQTDALELLGSYEQASWIKTFGSVLDRLESLSLSTVAQTSPEYSHCARHTIRRVRELRSSMNKSVDQQLLLSALQNLTEAVNFGRPDEIEAVVKPLLDFSARGVFQWEDGPLVNAIVRGHWFVVDNANLCPGSVLDRLNSLVETNGFLLLNEHAKPTTAAPLLRPHPNFRLFLSYNPKFGELSRAMRNRGVELHVNAQLTGFVTRHPTVTLAKTLSTMSNADILLMHKQATNAFQDALSLLPYSTRNLGRLARSVDAPEYYVHSPVIRLVQTMTKQYAKVCIDYKLPLDLAGSLPLDPLFSYAVNVPDNGTADLLSTRGRKIELALQFASSSIPGEVLAESPYKTLVQSLSAEALDLYVDGSTTASYKDQELVFLYLEMVELLKLPHQDHAMLQELLKWIEKHLENADNSKYFSKTRSRLRQVQTQTDLEQGRAIIPLWSSFYLAPRATLYQRWQQISEALKNLVHAELLPQDLRQLCVEVGSALQGSGALSEASSIRLSEMANLIVQRLEQTPRLDTLGQERISSLAILTDVAVQRALCAAPLSEGHGQSVLLTDFLSNKTLSENQALLEELYRSTVPTANPRITLRLLGRAIENIPVHGDVNSTFVQTAQFLDCITRTPLEISDYANQALKRATAALIASSRAWPYSVSHMSQSLARRFLTAIFEESVQGPHAKFPTASASVVSFMNHVQAIHPNSEFSRVSAEILKYQHLADCITQPQYGGLAVASECLAASLHLWKLFVTNVPFDPAIGMLAKSRSLSWRQKHLLRAIAQVQGYDPHLALPKSQNQWQDLSENQSQLDEQGNTPFVHRPQDHQRTLESLFEELRAADERFFSLHELNDLFGEISTARQNDQLQAIAARLESSISSLAVVKTRLSERFGDLEDLAFPPRIAIVLSICAFQHLLAHINDRIASPKVGATYSLARATTIFPPTESARQIVLESNSKKTGLPNHSIAVLQLQAFAYSRKIDSILTDPECDLVTGLYRLLYSSWDSLRKRMAAETAESESVYRTKNHDFTDLPPDGDEDDELNALFADVDPLKSTSTTQQIKRQLDDAALKAGQSHLVIFGQQSSATFDIRRFQSQRQEALEDMRQDLGPYSFTFDHCTSSFNIDSLIARTKSLQESDQPGSNFYKAEAPALCRPTFTVVASCAAQVGNLIAEFPDQMILQDLQDRLQALADMPLSSPPRKVLSSIESLLPVIEDWESVSNKTRSLAEHKASFIQEVIRYRQLELRSWPALLRDEECIFEQRALRWSMELLELILGSQDSATMTSPLDRAAFLDQATQIAQEFLQSSPTGQFLHRLELLRSFATHAERLKDRSLANILFAVSKAHERFVIPVENALRAARQEASKGIHDQIQLATWKDVNIHALQQSSQKSHHALYKVIRSFRVALQSALVEPPEMSVAGKKPALHLSKALSPRSGAIQCPQIASSLPRLDFEHVLKTVQKLQAVASSFNDAVGSDVAAHHSLTNYADSLREMVTELRQQDVEGKTPEERSKRASSLLSQKKRAVAEALKEMKRLGLSHNPASGTVENQKRLSAFFIAGSLDGKAQTTLQKHLDLDGSFNKLARMIQRARSTPAQHHEDISSRDVFKAVGVLESGLALLLSLRQEISGVMDGYDSLLPFYERMDIAAESGFQLAPTSESDITDNYLLGGSRLYQALEELKTTLDIHAHQTDQTSDPSSIIDTLQRSQDDLTTDLEALKAFISSRPLPANCHFDTQREASTKRQMLSTVAQIVTQLSNLGESSAWGYLLQPVEEVARSVNRDLVKARTQRRDSESTVQSVHENLISCVLLSAQDIDRLNRSAADADEEDGLARHVCLVETRRQISQLQALRLSQQLIGNQRLFESLAASSPQDNALAEQCLRRVYEFVQPYREILLNTLQASAQWHSSIEALLNVIAPALLDISEHGYCRPQEQEEDASAGQGEGEMELSEGTGMGSGSGSKNVSDQIEGEEQVAGLQDEPQEDERNEEDEDNKGEAIDMSGGLEGLADDAETQDVEEASDQDDGSDEDEGNDDDVEDAVDSVDPLASTAVDEKFWGDEEDKPESKPGEEHVDQPQNQQSKEQTGDLGEKQEDSNGAGPQSTEDQEPNAADHDEQGPEDMDDQQPHAQSEQDQVAMPEGENLDMPEDLDLDLPDEQQHAEEDQMDLDQDTLDNDPSLNDDPQSDANEGSDTEGIQENTDEDQKEDTEIEGALDSLSGTGEQPEQLGDEAHGAGLGGSNERNQEAQNSEVTEHQDQAYQRTESVPQQSAGNGEDVENQATSTDPEGRPDPNVKTDSADRSRRQSKDQRASEHLDEDRQLGDAMEEWSRKLEAMNATEDEKQEPLGQDSSDLQYVHEDQAADQQTLGPAQPNQATAASQLQIQDEDEELLNPEDQGFDDMELEEPSQSLPQPPTLEMTQSGQDSTRDSTNTAALTAAEVRKTSQLEQSESQQPAVDTLAAGEPLSLKLEEADIDAEQQSALDKQLLSWQTSDKESLSPSAAWSSYLSLTRPASFTLTEQLRLILEPTQATRLQGDYRSGKRLNMKRLIPYIASEFTKDKIWKRRTRPSDRAYQVLVALDDSKSMADPSMVHLTLQAVALVTSALERLEVGQVAVESFGQQVKVLHDFDAGQVDGKRILEGLTFSQNRTDYGLLLKSALDRFTQARLTAPPSSNGELWQLMLIISDGSMDNFESVRATLRQATQNKVFVVFIIVDSTRNQSGAVQGSTDQSILDRRFARVGNNPTTGQLEIQDARYMDLFPFDYYVVIREAQGLPEVLCRTLKQFFEMVQSK